MSSMRASDKPSDECGALEALLRWYDAMGVDAPVDEAPHDRFAASRLVIDAAPPPHVASAANAPAAAVPDPDSAAPAVSRSIATLQRPAETLVAEAEALAAGAFDLAELEARLATVPGCTLAASSRMIAAHMPADATLMLVGAAPGEDDERAGAIFAGKPGILLDAMLRAIGLARGDVALAHVVPWRPPGNRVPTPLELALCLPFIRRRIALAAPRLMLCLGERAAQPLLGSRDPLSRLRGRWLTYEGKATTVKTLATFAPGFLLGQPLQKRRAWADLLILEAQLGVLGRGEP